MNKLLLFASIGLIVVSCQSRDDIPSDVLPPETMKSILLDASIIEGALKANFILDDSAARVAPHYYQELYIKHQVSAETFEHSIKWYFQHPELMEEIQKEVINNLIERGS
jgi:hypothetical protein